MKKACGSWSFILAPRRIAITVALLVVACGSNEDLQAPEAPFEPQLATSTINALPPAGVTVSFAQETDPLPTVIIHGPGTTQTTGAESIEGLVRPSTTVSAATAPSELPLTPQAVDTPFPTYTAPARPEASPWDHYWFGRPVPAGSAVWTDKAYPYGSTRSGQLRTHHGVEFNVPSGTPVIAPANVTVIVAGNDLALTLGASPDFYGNVIVIEHDFSIEGFPVYTLYGHLSEILKQPGQPVQAGDVIALSGASGVADGAHLHFEVRTGRNDYDATRNPLLWLYPFPDRGVVAGRVTWPDGTLAREVPVSLTRIDGPAPYSATTTYADDSVNPDNKWQENFALDDVPVGFYRLDAGGGEIEASIELWVYARQTSYVELVLGS